MSTRRLSARIRSFEFIDVGKLMHHELRFHKQSLDGSGKCDVVAMKGQCVFGVVYAIDPAERPRLDRFEGVGNGYIPKTLEVVIGTGGKVKTFLYQATQIDASLKPYGWYKQHVLAGANEHQLPGRYRDWLKSIASHDDPDRERHHRELSIYAPL